MVEPRMDDEQPGSWLIRYVGGVFGPHLHPGKRAAR